MLLLDINTQTSAADLFEAYCDFAGCKHDTRTKFGTIISTRFIKKKISIFYYCGIKLKEIPSITSADFISS